MPMNREPNVPSNVGSISEAMFAAGDLGVLAVNVDKMLSSKYT